MAKRKPKRTNEVVHLSLKPLKNGNQRFFLDFYFNGKRRKEYLTNLLLVTPKTAADRAHNKSVRLEAETIRAEREREIVNGTFGTAKAQKNDNLLLLDFLESFKEWKAQKGQSKSNATTIKNLILHLKNYCGEDTTMSQIDKSFCNGFIDYLANAKAFGVNNFADRKKGIRKPLAKSTARLYYNTFVCALNRAAKEGIIDSNPANLIDREDKKPIQPKGIERAYLTPDEVKRLIETPYTNDSVKRAFLFACFCGLRISDVESLKWGELKSNGEGLMYISHTMIKTQDVAIVPLNDNAKQWLPERGDDKDSDFVFKGLPVNTSINHDIKHWAKMAGITKNICFHVSRHTFATLSLESGADIATVSSLLGHKSLRTTQIYAKVVDSRKADAVKKLDNLFSI